MKNTVRRYPRDTKDWWRKTLDDLKWAQYNFRGGFYSQTCFAAEQAGEKALKTYLLSKNIVVEKTHKLLNLLAQAIKLDSSFSDQRDTVKLLDRYYISTRYPSGFGPAGEYSQKEAEEALGLAKKLVEFVGKKT